MKLDARNMLFCYGVGNIRVPRVTERWGDKEKASF